LPGWLLSLLELLALHHQTYWHGVLQLLPAELLVQASQPVLA
jgi:hypothetical protein